MSVPAKQKTWVVTGNVAITGASLNLMMGNYLFQVAVTWLLANGYTCKGSSTGVAAAMDGVNRWATAANALVRAANTTTANSWIVLTDGNGCNVCLSYVGASDDVCRISFSPSGVYVAAGTATFTPTATDEVLLTAGGTIIDATAAGTARTYFGWVDSQAKMCRNLLSLNSTGSPAGTTWGVELFDSSLQSQVISPSVWGFAFDATNFTYGQSFSAGISGAAVTGTRGGRCRANATTINLNGAPIVFFGATAGAFVNVNTELQGTNGYPIWGPWRLGSPTATMTGVAGVLIDWWGCRNANAVATCNLGDTLDSKNYMVVGLQGGIMWPWDGATTPANGARGSANQLGTDVGSQNLQAPAVGSFMNGLSTYVPLANSRVTPIEGDAPSSVGRRPGVEVIRMRVRDDDPPAEPGNVIYYSRTIDDRVANFARYSDGTTYEVGA